MKPNFKLTICVLLAIALLNGCKYGSTGLFESIAGETPGETNPSNGFKFSAVGSVVRYANVLYATMGRLWEKADGQAFWQPVAALGDHYADDIAATDNGLFALVKDGAGTSLGIQIFNGSAWSALAVQPAFPAGYTARGFLSANKQVLVWAERYDSANKVAYYSLLAWTGSDFTDTGITDAAVGLPRNLIWDGSGYWLCFEKALYKGSQIDNFASVEGLRFFDKEGKQKESSNIVFGGIEKLGSGDSSEYILVDRNGYVYKSAGGMVWSDWQGKDLAFTDTSTQKHMSFNAPLMMQDGSVQLVLVPSRNLGASKDTYTSTGYIMLQYESGRLYITYNEEKKEFDRNPLSDYVNYDTTLRAASINRFVASSDAAGNPVLFAATLANGLWSNTRNAQGTWSGWLRESDR